ncbi:MAG: nitrite/sulfite reductase [Verrucomicrobiae bacterium]|nr:nitrite/sulfite reductase [Verrucomicrobiae bacterium]
MNSVPLSTPRNFTPGETPMEKLKVAKDGLDVLPDIARYAETGFASIPEDDFDRLKWFGVYRQRPKDSGYFMLRTKIPGGQLNAAQLDVIADLAEQYGHGIADITTRQTFQMHWLRIEHFTDIFARLKAVGITTSGACGDDTRNVVGCPVAGIDHEEIIDATPYLHVISQHLTDNREFSNLPRKYKISISGCRIHCAQPDINCVGFFGLERTVNGQKEVGFGLKVGGGLSSAPHLAKTLPIFIPEEEVLTVAHYISVIYRDYGYRHARNKARFKFLVADWGVDKVVAELERLSGKQFDRHTEFDFPHDPESDHLAVCAQKQSGLYYVGISFAGGRARFHQLKAIADLARRYCKPAQDAIRTTNKQNLIILNVPQANVEPLKKEIESLGLAWNPSNFRQGCVSCTGIEFCNLAIAETKNRMIELVAQLEKQCAFYDEKIRIHFSGCPSSCGQHQIADIGFRGGMTKVNGVSTECFDMFLGGKVGRDARFNQLVKGKVLSTEIHNVIEKVLRYYQDKRNSGESFADFCSRTPREEWTATLG